MQEIKSHSCTRHCYDAAFIGEQDRKMGLVIFFTFYELALSTFLSSKDMWKELYLWASVPGK